MKNQKTTLNKAPPLISKNVSSNLDLVYESTKMGKKPWPAYMLNYQAYYKNPLDYKVSPKKINPIKKRHFLDGIDPNFLLKEEDTRVVLTQEQI